MSVYHQMGHDSRNLLFENNLSAYSGAILSPVNYTEAQMAEIIRQCVEEDFEFIFDCQLYYPHTEIQNLIGWDYFPHDLNTGDTFSWRWWKNLIPKIGDTVERLDITAVASPIIVPRIFSLEYYDLMEKVGSELHSLMERKGIQTLLTMLIDQDFISDIENVYRLASIFSRQNIKRILFVLNTSSHPREELSDGNTLVNTMFLISLLQKNNVEVLFSHCSSEFILWQKAGANSFATGKFFNLRRFTPSRWTKTEDGGGQLPYWIEESLLGFLRESDLLRVRNAGLFSEESNRNPYSKLIIDAVENGNPWLKYSWRKFLYWFADLENRLNNGIVTPIELLTIADRNWTLMDEKKVILEERKNNGSWIRNWMRAIVDFEELNKNG